MSAYAAAIEVEIEERATLARIHALHKGASPADAQAAVDATRTRLRAKVDAGEALPGELRRLLLALCDDPRTINGRAPPPPIMVT